MATTTTSKKRNIPAIMPDKQSEMPDVRRPKQSEASDVAPQDDQRPGKRARDEPIQDVSEGPRTAKKTKQDQQDQPIQVKSAYVFYPSRYDEFNPEKITFAKVLIPFEEDVDGSGGRGKKGIIFHLKKMLIGRGGGQLLGSRGIDRGKR